MIPTKIELIVNKQKVVESLGWQPGIFGVLLTIVACFFHAPASYTPNVIETAIFAAIGIAGLGLLYYEIWRRKNRTVFVRDGDVIAVFHGTRLDRVCKAAEIKPYNMPLEYFLLILFALLFFAVGFFLFAATVESLERGYRILNAVASLAMVASAASLIRTRFFCDALLLPGKKKQFFLESVLIHTSQRKILFPIA
jgi:hypothetical protein